MVNVLMTVLGNFEHRILVIFIVEVVTGSQDIFQLMGFTAYILCVVQAIVEHFVSLQKQPCNLQFKLRVVKAYLLYLLLEIQIFPCKELDIVLHIPQLHISVLRTRRLLSELVNLNLKLHTVGPKIIDQNPELCHFFG